MASNHPIHSEGSDASDDDVHVADDVEVCALAVDVPVVCVPEVYAHCEEAYRE